MITKFANMYFQILKTKLHFLLKLIQIKVYFQPISQQIGGSRSIGSCVLKLLFLELVKINWNWTDLICLELPVRCRINMVKICFKVLEYSY